jgi:integrase
MLRRKEHFTVRVHVPADLRPLVGRREVWRSTQTANRDEAKMRAALIRGHVSSLFVHLRRSSRHMSRDEIASLVHEYLSARLDEVEETFATGTSLRSDVNREAWEDELRADLIRIEAKLASADHSDTLPLAVKMLPHGDEVSQAILARRLLEAQHEAAMRSFAALGGEPLRPARMVSGAAKPRATGPLLSAVCSDFIETTATSQRWTATTRQANEAALAMLVSFVGDKPIATITKAEVREAYLLLPRSPSNASKKYPGLSPRDAIDAADAANDQARLAPRTSNIRLQTWKALFTFAVNADLIDKSAAAPLKTFAEGSAQEARAAFTDAQLSAYFKLLRGDAEKHPEFLGVGLAMLYGGLRLEEAASLRGSDIREERGVWVFDVNARGGRGLKTENAARLVPIHSAVLPHFRSLAKKAGPEGNLWGLEPGARGRYSHEVSKAMNRRLAKAIPGKPEGLVTYSLRHTFATRLKASDVQEFAISELMGHAVESMSVGRYGKKLEVSKLKDAVEKLEIPAAC